VEVVLVVRVLAAVAIVVSAQRAWTGPTLRIRGPSCVYAARRAFTRPIVRKRRGCVNAHPGVYTRESAFTRTLGAYMQEVCLRTRVRIREIVRLRERWVRIRTYLRTRTRCVYAGGCVYASAGCIYAAGAYTHPGAYTRLGAFTRAVVRIHSGCVYVPPRVYTGFCVYAPPTA